MALSCVIMPPVRATPGLKMMRPLIASSARRSSLLHAERWAPFPAIVYFYAYCLNKCLEITKSSLCLFGSTTVETVETSIATVVPATSWPYPPTPDPCECAICATPSCCREAPPQLPDKAMKHWTHSSTTVFHHSSTEPSNLTATGLLAIDPGTFLNCDWLSPFRLGCPLKNTVHYEVNTFRTVFAELTLVKEYRI